MPTEEWSPSPNFSSREGRKVITIVDHITSGNFPGCLEWLQNPASQASAHYIVTRLGRIIQLVKEGDKAWANGSYNHGTWPLYDGTNPNLYTLSIEHEGFDGSLTEVQYQATLFLHRELTQKYNIPIDRDHIIGHYRLDPITRPNCPGPNFPWDRLFNDLKGDVTVNNAVVYFSAKDFSTALMFADKFGGCAMFCRNAGASVHADAMKASQVFTIGGPKLGHPNEVYLSGNTAVDTAKVAIDWLLAN